MVIAAPPLEVGVVQLTIELPLSPEVAVTPVGAPGTPIGVAVGEGTEAVPVPALFVAVTVNV